jgi:hypothetical protein
MFEQWPEERKQEAGGRKQLTDKVKTKSIFLDRMNSPCLLLVFI